MTRHDAKRHTDDARALFEQFSRQGAEIQKTWQKDHWFELNRTVVAFCMASQRMNTSIGGLQVRAFREANEVLGNFVTYASELLEEASQQKALPEDESILNNILGVIERCNLRIAELEEKRSEIDIYRKKIEELTDP